MIHSLELRLIAAQGMVDGGLGVGGGPDFVSWLNDKGKLERGRTELVGWCMWWALARDGEWVCR